MSAAQSVPALIRGAARQFADRLAVIDGDRSLSFRQVEERSNRLANALLALAPGEHTRVALLMPNRLEFVELDFAIAKAGKVKLPINPRLADREREYLLDNSGAKVLVFDAVFADFVAAARANLPALETLIVIDGAFPGALDYEAVVADGADRAPKLAYSEADPSFILYTSGTTGRPKGAVSAVSGRRAATNTMLAEEIDVGPGAGMVHAGSVAHGSGSKILAYFLGGGSNIMMRKWEPAAFLQLVGQHQATASFLVPTMISALVEEAKADPSRASSLRTISYGGAPIAPARLQEAMSVLGQVFVQVYGSCEAPHPLTIFDREAHAAASANPERLATIGRPTQATEIRLVGADGAAIEPGDRGEMQVRSAHLMSGYWENPEATEEVMRDGWYSTGDVASVDEDGFYYIVDRVRDMIISGGLNVYPAEVEAMLHEHPGVSEVAVIGVPDEKWGEAVKAVVVLRPGKTTSAEQLVEFCQARLAGYKKPQSIDFVDELPKGATGKILKREIRERYWKGIDRRVQ